MKIFTYGFARVPLNVSLYTLYGMGGRERIPGLIHDEMMWKMQLGSPIFSPSRMQFCNLIMFAAWESNQAVDDFCDHNQIGQIFKRGWHIRMRFIRRWGVVKELDWLPENSGETIQDAPVVAVTLARMRITEVPRFIQWGKPVEELVRDHPGAIFSTASMRLPNTVSTFSIWSNQKEMLGMVHGHSHVKNPERHAVAMRERDRKDFHYEFTTLRFAPIEEHGCWDGRSKMLKR